MGEIQSSTRDFVPVRPIAANSSGKSTGCTRCSRTGLSPTLDDFEVQVYYHCRETCGGEFLSTPTSPGKTRSPNYPSISLEEAVHRLKTIYEKQQRYTATREVLAQLMGYKGLNGASATVVSALSKY